jgi:DNA (cytosine-5)-methyltransferase 1
MSYTYLQGQVVESSEVFCWDISQFAPLKSSHIAEKFYYNDREPWRGIADVVCGGFPCQDISVANPNGKGLTGKRSGLWTEMVRIINDIKPRYIFVENSSMLTIRGLGTVLRNLACMGYDAKWCVLGSDHAGLLSLRRRIWILASPSKDKHFIKTKSRQWEFSQQFSRSYISTREKIRQEYRREFESRTDRIINGVAHQMDRLAAIGNGQVPIVAATAWRILEVKHEI